MRKLLTLIIALVVFVAGCTTSSKPIETSTISVIDFSALVTANPPEFYYSTTTTLETTRQEHMVWIPQSGKKYHLSSKCSGMKNPSRVTISTARRNGYGPCSKCYN